VAWGYPTGRNGIVNAGRRIVARPPRPYHTGDTGRRPGFAPAPTIRHPARPRPVGQPP
jgi:hypothetical protein